MEGNAPLVLEWYLREHRQGRKKKMPDGLEAAARKEGWEAADEASGASAEDAPPQLQPPIVPADREAVLVMLTARIGLQQPNGVHTQPLADGASAAQRSAYEHSHVTNPETDQVS